MTGPLSDEKKFSDKYFQANIVQCIVCKAKIKNRYGQSKFCTCTTEVLRSMRSPGGIFFVTEEGEYSKRLIFINCPEKECNEH
jgi:hypothetical protein